jgi:hypothetical protein
VTIQGMQISGLTESIDKGHAFLTFDVCVSGHLISTVSVPHLGGRILWSQASIYGFDDFNSTDHRVIEQMIRACLSSSAGQAQFH